jgi:hypothetical protein
MLFRIIHLSKTHKGGAEWGKDRIANHDKYFVTDKCQSLANAKKTDWLEIIKELKSCAPRDVIIQKSQIIEARDNMNDGSVILKVGDSRINDEYIMMKKVQSIKGFIKPICKFECEDDLQEYFEGRRKTICKSPGKGFNVMILPVFTLGSIADYEWVDRALLVSCLQLAVVAYAEAFWKIGFVHNDFHAGNILLKKTRRHNTEFVVGETQILISSLRPWISDLETSYTVESHDDLKAWEDFKYDVQKLFFILPSQNTGINKNSISQVIQYLSSLNKKPDSLETFMNGILPRITTIELM